MVILEKMKAAKSISKFHLNKLETALARWYSRLEAPYHTPKGCGIDSRSEPIPGLQVPSPVGAPAGGNPSMFLSHTDVSLFLSPFISL